MKQPLTFLLLLFLLATSYSNAQQVKDTGTNNNLPLKTAVLRDASAGDASSYLSSAKIVRFWVYKAGSTTDVQKMVAAFSKAKGVTGVKEGDLNGDYKEFVLTLDKPRDLGWYGKLLAEAGITHLKFNEYPARPVSGL